MATLKTLLYTSKILSNGESPIMIRLTIDLKSSYISIGHTCKPEHWNFEKDESKKKAQRFKELSKRNQYLIFFDNFQINYFDSAH